MKKNRSLSSRISLVLAVLLITTLACNLGFSIPQAGQGGAQETPSGAVISDSSTPAVSVSTDLVSQQDALISLYESVSPGVVSILVVTDQGVGQGSGFVIDNQGHIVTNYHVVQGGNYMEVSFSSGFKAEADIVGVDTDSDLAVIKVNLPEDDLHPVTLGNSDDLQVGQIVVAIGNPFGFGGSMSTGIVSSLGRTLDSLNESPEGQFFSAGDVIQTDAAINPGNSGGPLLNLRGEVVGVNRAISTFNFNDAGDTLNSGIGFAVSVNIVKRVAPALINEGHYDYPYLGISSLSTLTLADAEQLGLDRTTGAVVSQVVADGPADNAGLLVGDLIIQVDDRQVNNFDQMLSYLFNHTSPGDSVQMVVVRDGEEVEIELTLGARP